MHPTHTAGELFESWHNQKQQIDAKEKKLLFREGDIWWCSIGKNIGAEQDGKNEFFERPVLIYKKFNYDQFLGFPMTSKSREGKYYFPYHIGGGEGSIIFSQIRVFSSKRLQRKIGTMSAEIFTEFSRQFKESLP